MLTGWQKLGGSWYYFDGSGHMLTGWQKIGGNWFYMNGNGQMLTGFQDIGGNTYYFDGSGHMATGWKQLGYDWYRFDGSGHMYKGWVTNGSGTKSYFYPDGRLAIGPVTLDGKTYIFDKDGILQNISNIGIDVSAYQGEINWKLVKEDGVDFAFVRAGYRGYGTGKIAKDAYFDRNMKGASENGIKLGINFYTQIGRAHV